MGSDGGKKGHRNRPLSQNEENELLKMRVHPISVGVWGKVWAISWNDGGGNIIKSELLK